MARAVCVGCGLDDKYPLVEFWEKTLLPFL